VSRSARSPGGRSPAGAAARGVGPAHASQSLGRGGGAGLYRGQALTSRDTAVSAALYHAAAEEADHLAWCEGRLRELEGRTSVLNPCGTPVLSRSAPSRAQLGRSTGLGFVAETERQVESHLRGHMERLGSADPRSRAILERMTHDEMQHGAKRPRWEAKSCRFRSGWRCA